MLALAQNTRLVLWSVFSHSASEFFDNTNTCLTGVGTFHENQACEFEASLTDDSDAQISFGCSYTY